MKDLTDWQKTLQNIVYHHNSKSIEFPIEDIENLATYINNLHDTILRLVKEKEKLVAKNKILDTALLRAIVTSPSENLNTFKIYA